MNRWIILIAVASTALVTSGCSLCCGPYDFDYPNFGGITERVDPTYGRVGSIFSDPNAGFAGPSANSNLEPQPEPRVNRDDDIPDDSDLERLKKELEDDLESIDPNKNRGGAEELPSPPNADDTTASRMWKNRPLRSKQTWR